MPSYVDWDRLEAPFWDDPLTDWDGAGSIPPVTPVPPRTTYPVDSPERFLAELHRSHQIATEVRVLSGHHIAARPLITGGEINVDLTQSVRRSGHITIIDPSGDLIVDETNDLLAPLGPEVKVLRGVRYADGFVHLASLGVFGIYDVNIKADASGVELDLQLFDRSRRLAENQWEDVWQAPPGVDYADAIQALIEDRLPGSTYRFQPTGHTTPRNLVFGAEHGGDPNQDAQRMAASVGYDVAPASDGAWVLQAVATRSDPIIDRYKPDRAKLLAVDKTWTREDTYSVVVVTGERTGETPVQSVARDNDPDSPTYWKGLFGSKVLRYQSEFITTQAQADEAAAAMLARKSGASELISIDGVVNPALDAGDVIAIENLAAKVNARYLIETFNVPLKATDSQTLTCRKRRIV